MATAIVIPVVPVGRGAADVAVRYHHVPADAWLSASEIRALQRTVAAQALTIAGQDRVIAEQAEDLARGPRWHVVRVPLWRAPERALPALAALAMVVHRIGPALERLYQGRG